MDKWHTVPNQFGDMILVNFSITLAIKPFHYMSGKSADCAALVTQSGFEIVVGLSVEEIARLLDVEVHP